MVFHYFEFDYYDVVVVVDGGDDVVDIVDIEFAFHQKSYYYQNRFYQIYYK